MKRYKAIFDIPDDVFPPSQVGFQIVKPTGNPNQPVAPQVFAAPLIPVAYYAVEDGVYAEVIGNKEGE